MKTCGHLPLISPWLFRLEVWRAARRATTGDVPAVRELTAVFCTSPDPKSRDLAGRGLSHLWSSEQIDLLCHESLLRDDDDLIALATGCGYLPAAPASRALWFFCTSPVNELRRPASGIRLPLLSAGYRDAEAAVRVRALDAARRDGTWDILGPALAGPDITRNAAIWSFWEWEVVMRGFSQQEQWDNLWLLVPLAPLPLALEAVRSLKAAGWSPQGEDRALWQDLARNLPDHWIHLLGTGEPRHQVGRPAGQVSRLCFSPDGSLLATGCCDGMISVWRTATAGIAAEFSGGAGSVRFLAITAGNGSVVSAGDDATVHCHRLGDGALLWSWKGRGGDLAVSLSPDGRTLLAGDSAGSLHVLDTLDGRVVHTLSLHPAPVTCLSPALKGSVVACGHADGTVSVIRPGDGTGPLILPGNGSPVLALSVSSSGAECLAVYERGHPVEWDIAGREKNRVFTGHRGRGICSAVPADGWFAVGSDDHTLRCWDLTLPEPAAVIPFYSRHITSCSAAPGGSFLAAGFHDGSVRVYRMPGAQLVREYKAHKKAVTSCTLAPGGTRLATVSWDGTTKLWGIPDGEIVRTFDPHAGGITALTGPSGTLVAAVTEDGIARVIDASDGSIQRTLDLYTPSVRAAAMSPDGSYLVCTGADSSVRCWNIRDGSLASAGKRQAASLWCCAIIPGSLVLVTGGWDGTCRFFTLPEVRPLRTLAGHTSVVTCCTVSPDGSLLVTGSNDTTVRLWRIAEDGAYAVLCESRSEVGAVALSPDGTLLASGTAEGMIRFYRLPYGTPEGGLPGLTEKVTSLLFTSDGCFLAAGYGNGACALFSVRDRSLLRMLPAHSSAVTGLVILPDGRTLVSTGKDGICRFHALPYIPFLVHASLADIPAGAPPKPGTGRPGPDPSAFHRFLLAARFQGEIGICPALDPAGCYDIQIVG